MGLDYSLFVHDGDGRGVYVDDVGAAERYSGVLFVSDKNVYIIFPDLIGL